MQIIADLQLHSKYSRAVSQNMILSEISRWSSLKGIGLVATGDWTHPIWFRFIKDQLKETSDGIFTLKERPGETQFLLSTEISSIYTQGDQVRRVHNLIFSPSIETCEKIIKKLNSRGANLIADGRPIVGVSSVDLLKIVLEIDPRVLFVPAHIWTPWFAVFGSKSGFDSLEECFGDYDRYIYAVESGLSCYDKETEVLTQGGWKRFSNITYTDKICTLNLKNSQIEYQNPIKIQRYRYKGKMYKLKTKRVDLLVTPNHKLLYSPCDFRNRKPFILKEAELLFNKSKILKKDGNWKGKNDKFFILPAVKAKHGSRYYSGLRDIKEKKLLIKPWLKFFGFWIAEGWVTSSGDGSYNVCLANSDKELLREMKEILEQLKYDPYLHNKVIRIRNFQLYHYLKQFGKCTDKFVPLEVKSLSKDLLQIFLDYYIKGDGHIYGRNGKGLSATTLSIKLRDDLQEIALKIGISAYYKKGNKKGTPITSLGEEKKKYKQSADAWIIFFIRRNKPIILPSLIKKYKYTESWVNFNDNVFCVSVPNHVVYIRRNGIPLWCGNSDPVMNWQIKELENRSIVSFSDAHSGPKLGREATVFSGDGSDYTYDDIADAIKQKQDGKLKIGYTIEFFPEEGKYHWTGHRACNIRYAAADTKEKGITCPVCGRPLTVGVENRVLELSEKLLTEKDLQYTTNNVGLIFVYDKDKKRKPFVSIIPLLEVLLETNGHSQVKAQREYERLTAEANEFDILLKKTYEEIEKLGGAKLKEAIQIVRERKVFVDPGYDGVFGKVQIFKEANEKAKKDQENQQTLF